MINEPESKGENLLAQQVLFGESVLEYCQRSNFFRNYCTYVGKIWNVIMDSDSIDNLVAKEMT